MTDWGGRGRRKLEKEKPPILGMIQRSGQVVIKMLSDVKQRMIKPLITETIAPGAMVMTDEYDIYAKLPECGYGHKFSTGQKMMMNCGHS